MSDDTQGCLVAPCGVSDTQRLVMPKDVEWYPVMLSA